MPSARLTAAKGIISSSNELSRPDGALTVADNVVIDFDNSIQQRRGNKEYSQLFATPPKELFTYKNTVLVHHDQTMSFDSLSTGNFVALNGAYNELVPGLRIKSLEANGNFYFTTSEGIKKISVKNATDMNSTTIVNAGAAEAIDLTAKAIPNAAGFLPAQSKVAYRMLFGYKDANSNLLRGVPTSRTIVTNFSQDVNASEIFTINIVDYAAIPTTGAPGYFLFDTIDSSYYVWFKGGATQVAPNNADTLDRIGILVDMSDTSITYSNTVVAGILANALSNADAGVSIEITGNEVEVTVNTAGDVTDPSQGNLPTGTVLVSPIVNGSVANGVPALAELNFTLPPDVDATYFYQIYRTGVVTVSPGVTLNDIDPGDEHYFVYEAPVTSADVTAGEITLTDNTPEAFRQSGAYLYTNAITGEPPGGITQANSRPPIAQDIASFRSSAFYANTKDYHIFNMSILSVDDFVSGSTKLYIKQGTEFVEYTFVGVPEVTDVTVLAKSGTAESSYFTLNSASDERQYYVWMDKGAGVDPALVGKTGIRVPLELYPDSVAGSKQALLETLLEFPDFSIVDFNTDTVRITCADAGAVTDPVNSGTGWTISVVTQGDGEDSIAKEVLLSQSASVGVAIDLTARSLCRVINKDIDSPVTAQYLSGVDDLPGKILLKSKNLTDSTFYVAISDPALSVEFMPELPTWDGLASFPITAASDNNETPNRLYYSKINQPEAVPSVNYIDIGSKDKAILRILALRDNLFVFKEDGIFILSGNAAPAFTARLLDNSAILIAPDTAKVLNNQIFCLTTQGLVAVSDTGVSIIGRQIEDLIKKVTTFAFNYKYVSFGVSYESDRAYFIWLPTAIPNTAATQCFRYSTITNTWTRWTNGATCGIVNYLGDDRLYLGSSPRNYITQERKNNERQDFADRDFIRSLGAGAVNDTSMTLSSVVDVEVGDVIVQEQFMSITKFNRLLTKLDSDSGPAFNDYITLAVDQGVNLANSLLALVAKLNADTNLATFTTPTGTNTPAALMEEYNELMEELNLPNSGTSFKNYRLLSDKSTYEVKITAKAKNSNTVIVDRATWFVQGDVTIYKAIKTEVQWAPQHFGKPEELKQVTEGTVIFDQNTISNCILSYASDRSQDFTDIPVSKLLSGPGFWACFNWVNIPWGGLGSEIPVRTLIPQNKSRCRYIHVKYQHSNAREQYKILGISLETRDISSRGYK